MHRLFSRATEPSCPKCAFSLKGLPDHGSCPECGASYEPGDRFALTPPSPLRAIWFGGAPLAWGVLALTLAAVTASNASSESSAIAVAVLGAILACASIVWASVRFVTLIDALHKAMPRDKQERSATRAFGCVSTGVAGIIGVVAFGMGLLLTVMLGACLVERAG